MTDSIGFWPPSSYFPIVFLHIVFLLPFCMLTLHRLYASDVNDSFATQNAFELGDFIALKTVITIIE